MTNCNEFLITLFTDPENVVSYQVYYKVFSLPSGLFFLILTPLWSAITKAKVEGNYPWLLNLHKLVCGLIFLSIISTYVLVPLFPYVVKIWLQGQAEQLDISTSYSLWFALWSGANMLFHGNCTFANGLEALKIQKRFVPVGGILNALCAFVAAQITGSWLSIVQMNILILFLIGLVQLFDIHKMLNEKCHKEA